MSIRSRWPALLAAFGLFATAAQAQLALNESEVFDRLLVELAKPYPLPADAYSDVLSTTGDAQLDGVLSALGVEEVRRVFRRPPRGWRSEAAAAAAGLDRWLIVDFGDDRADIESARDMIQAESGVLLVERELWGTVADTTPNDPSFSSQYSLQNGRLNAPQAWDRLTDSTHVVAVTDTGVELSHDDLRANLWVNSDEINNNGIDDDNNGYIDDRRGWDFFYDDNRPDDKFGHGVHCTGTIGAATNNDHQVAGVCWNVPVMNVKIFSDGGGGDYARSAAGTVYAADNGASVISMSWGFSAPSSVLEDAIDYAHALDIVQVAAAHNFGSTNRYYPAAYRRVMGVIATDSNDNKTSWSNYGSWCDIAAPGDSILSTYLGNSVAYLSGTSMSTPHVAGAAALVREYNPSLDAVDTRWVLNYSAVDLGASGFDINYGWGRLDLEAAMAKADALRSSAQTAVAGDTITFDLHQPSGPGFAHVMLATRDGRRPGMSLMQYDPADYRQIAINPDPAMFGLILLGGAGIYQNFIGNFDGAGQSTATFNVPSSPAFSDTAIDFAWVSFDPNDVSEVSEISGTNRVTIE